MTSPDDTQSMLAFLDGSGSEVERSAIALLRQRSDLPQLLLGKYKLSRRWGARAACVYYSLPYARESSFALELGVTALGDKSKVVRYRATMLLAFAQSPEALGPLRALIDRGLSVEDARAAMDAIKSKNHHYFVDREHSGNTTMNFVEAR